MTVSELAVQELVAAVEENKLVHADNLQSGDEASRRRLDESAMRVVEAFKRWHQLFKPGASSE